MKKSQNKESVTDWWLPTRLLQDPDKYPAGFCAHAEHWYLALLILIASDPKLKKNAVKMLQKNALATRLDTRKKVKTSGIMKLHAMSQGKQYWLGYESFLILTGPLAGTLADYTEKKQFLRKKKLELTTVRPINPHAKILPQLTSDINIFSGVNQHLVDILGETKDEIIKREYIPALLFYLRKAGISHSKRKILENQRRFEDYLR